MTDIWPMVHVERQALLADLGVLSLGEWESPSLCQGWTVHDVVAHLVDNARTTPPRWLVAMVRARFDFDRQNALGVAREKGVTPAQTLRRLRQVANRTSGPPAPLVSRLVEEIVHGEDIRRPLGLTREYPIDAVVLAVNHQAATGDALGGAKSLAQRVQLVASDSDLVVGEGPPVHGSTVELLMLATHRPVRPLGLTGPGTSAL